jgi:hypothetical protein
MSSSKNLSVKGLCGSFVYLSEAQSPIPPFTHCILYNILIHTGKVEGGSWTREKARGATVHKAGSKTPT